MLKDKASIFSGGIFLTFTIYPSLAIKTDVLPEPGTESKSTLPSTASKALSCCLLRLILYCFLKLRYSLSLSLSIRSGSGHSPSISPTYSKKSSLDIKSVDSNSSKPYSDTSVTLTIDL